jgi:hypothetical protein
MITAMAESTRENVQVTERTKAAVVEICEWSGLSQKLVVERALSWLGQQDQDVQGAILMAVPAAMQRDFARLVLEKMAGEAPPAPPAADDAPASWAPTVVVEGSESGDSTSGAAGASEGSEGDLDHTYPLKQVPRSVERKAAKKLGPGKGGGKGQ